MAHRQHPRAVRTPSKLTVIEQVAADDRLTDATKDAIAAGWQFNRDYGFALALNAIAEAEQRDRDVEALRQHDTVRRSTR